MDDTTGEHSAASLNSSRSRSSRSSRHIRSTGNQSNPTHDKGDRSSPRPTAARKHAYQNRRSSAYQASSSAKRHAQPGSIEDILGSFYPKLSRIIEDKESRHHHRRRRRSRPTDTTPGAAGLGHVDSRRTARYRQSTLQHHFGVLSNPSLASLLSTLTSTSSGSSGSNSTVTQKSYDRTVIKKRRKKRSAERSNVGRKIVGQMQRRDSKLDMEDEEKGDEESPKPESPSISQFEHEEAPEDVTLTQRASPTIHPQSTDIPTDFVREDWKRQETFNSDSGISVSSSPENNARPEKAAYVPKSESDRNSDPSDSDSDSDDEGEDDDEHEEEDEDEDVEEEPVRPCPTARSSSTTITEESHHSKPLGLPDNDSLVQRLREQEEEIRQHILHSPRPQRALRTRVNSAFQPSSPLPLYDHHPPSVPHGYPYPPFPPPPPPPHALHGDPAFTYANSMQQHLPPNAPFGLDLQKTTIAGYELVASKLANRSPDGTDEIIPIYRKFEHLNHRVLLHVQDEISELEEELRILDESIAQMTPSTETNTLQPASRRQEARYGSELHFERTHVLGRVFMKLEQYNQALASFKSATKVFSPAEATDVAAYREFMEKHAPIEQSEARFLSHKHEQDLMALSNKSSAPPRSKTINVRHACGVVFILVLLPLLAFLIIGGFFARMIIVLLVALPGMMISSTVGLVDDSIPLQEFAAVASLYFALMSLTAVVMR